MSGDVQCEWPASDQRQAIREDVQSERVSECETKATHVCMVSKSDVSVLVPIRLFVHADIRLTEYGSGCVERSGKTSLQTNLNVADERWLFSKPRLRSEQNFDF